MGIITLLLFMLLSNSLLKKVNKILKWIALGYYVALSAIFLFGDWYITNHFHLKNGPVPKEGFATHFDWISTFGYFYLIPMVIIVIYVSLRGVKNIYPKGLRVFLSIFIITVSFGMGYIALFCFVLIFYGFAP
ncbi:hypothetical protein [Radiobacillus deserti]|uniref:Uncharacterized protein n=1 Tax=Radiobacillus deserti TaxID=2594883 RepID=A0A516KFN7_9BACI|nr:hypothetical protein [Radiobacillus deserti]QDP40225.1 hypothetical protein FN924_08590 [Radiobacillus deserti]